MGSVNDLSSRAILGMFFHRLEVADGMGWINAISNYFASDQESETYKWLGEVPALREWIGGRQAKGFTTQGITIVNKHYEATIEFLLKDMRRDKTGQIQARIGEFADRAVSHWASLLTTAIIAGESTVCYDGQFFFDTDHSEGDSGTQSNDISVDISSLPVTNHGSVTAPSVGEMAGVIQQAIAKLYSFKDDRGEPLNEMARQFLVMVPVPLADVAMNAIRAPFIDTGAANPIGNTDYKVTVATNPRLTWTDKLAVFRADAAIKSLIRQEEQGLVTKVKDENSEYAFDNDQIQIGIDTWRNVGFGRWQNACLATMT